MILTSKSNLEIIDWGLLGYEKSIRRQKTLFVDRLAGAAPDRLVLVEHPPVVTMGQRADSNDLRISKEALREKGIDLRKTDRGGMATFHGPGQMVAYPILKLEQRDIHLYVRTLEQVIAAVLRDYGLEPEFKEGKPGVWVKSSKIASIGIAVRKWVTYHGIALNVNTDLDAFNWIVPCGHPGETITSMEQAMDRPVDLARVKNLFIEHFRISFGYAKKHEHDRKPGKHPSWLKRPAPTGEMERLLKRRRLNTVCRSACCPNQGECFNRGTATFMILGDRCTRNCRFCAVDHGVPQPVDQDEATRIAQTAQDLGLEHVVITSVTRDDLADGGAKQFARTTEAVRSLCPDAGVEVLIPDFKGNVNALNTVCDTQPDVFNHNVETVPRLYSKIRPQAQYQRSLHVLDHAGRAGLRVKSGLMLGLGETRKELLDVFSDLLQSGCQYLTLGQYLSPSKNHAPVIRYIQPEAFDELADIAVSLGFKEVAAGPFVRSSYRAEKMVGK